MIDYWIFMSKEDCVAILDLIEKSDKEYIWMKAGEFKPFHHKRDWRGATTKCARITREFRNPRPDEEEASALRELKKR